MRVAAGLLVATAGCGAGSQFGSYRILRSLGAGGMGKVFEAELLAAIELIVCRTVFNAART